MQSPSHSTRTIEREVPGGLPSAVATRRRMARIPGVWPPADQKTTK